MPRLLGSNHICVTSSWGDMICADGQLFEYCDATEMCDGFCQPSGKCYCPCHSEKKVEDVQDQA